MDFLVIVIILITIAYFIGDNRHEYYKHNKHNERDKSIKFHPNGYSFILLDKDKKHLMQFTMKKMYDVPSAKLYYDFDISNIIKNNIVDWYIGSSYTKIYIIDCKDTVFVFDMSTSNDLTSISLSHVLGV